jgi:aminopeptidase C
MVIVGYELDPNSKMRRLLIRNSMGNSFGENGLAVISMEYFEKYFSDLYFLSNI